MEPNNTDPTIKQDDIPLSTDELAAAMGFMTSMGDQQMMAQMPQQEVAEEPKEEKGDLESFKEEIRTMIKEEIGGIKKDIEEVLKEEDKDEEE